MLAAGDGLSREDPGWEEAPCPPGSGSRLRGGGGAGSSVVTLIPRTQWVSIGLGFGLCLAFLSEGSRPCLHLNRASGTDCSLGV